jgi:hypothetical protein
VTTIVELIQERATLTRRRLGGG